MELKMKVLALCLLLTPIFDSVLADGYMEDDGPPTFKITTSRRIDEPPSIEVSFSNGVKDDLVLTHYKMYQNSHGGCNYLGHLKNDPTSSAAVTGCLNNSGDKIEVTLLSEHTTNSMFVVDILGNTEALKYKRERGT